jgi:hypothetical protein
MKKQELGKYLLSEQYKLIGKTFDEVAAMSRDEFLSHKITMEQSMEWSKWAVAELRKRRFSKKLAEREIAWMDLQYGLSLIYPDDK